MKWKSKRHVEVQQPVFVRTKEFRSDDDWHVEGDDDEETGTSRETSLGNSPVAPPRRRVTQRHEFKMKIKASREEIAEFERFSKEVEEVRPLFDEMSTLVRRMRRIAGDDDAVYSAESEQEFEELKEQVNEVSNAIRSKILVYQNDQKTRKGPFAEVKGKILATLINELVGLTNRYKEALMKHDENMKDRVARYIHEVNEEQEEESAERYDEHMKPDTFFQRYVFKEDATRVRNHLKEKNRDLAKIEKDLVELQSIMQDISALVEHQNELLDQIEHNIDSAKATIEKATQEVEETRVIVQQIRRKKLMTFLTIGLIVVIVIVVIVVVAVILL